MKLKYRNKRCGHFFAGMLVMLMLTTLIAPSSAASGKVDFNQVGIRVLRQQKVLPGDMYVAPNGQQVPSTITYTDVTGGKTNYVSVRHLSELIDADVSWNEKENSIDVGVFPGENGFSVISSAEGGVDELNTKMNTEFGGVIGALTEVSPESVAGLLDGTAVPSRSYAYHTRIQYGMGSLFPEITVTAKPTLGKWLVYSVTNNGETEQEVVVSRRVAITTGRREAFPNVMAAPGETVIRAFRIADDADLMKSTFVFSVHGIPDREKQTDVTVSVLLYN